MRTGRTCRPALLRLLRVRGTAPAHGQCDRAEGNESRSISNLAHGLPPVASARSNSRVTAHCYRRCRLAARSPAVRQARSRAQFAHPEVINIGARARPDCRPLPRQPLHRHYGDLRLARWMYQTRHMAERAAARGPTATLVAGWRGSCSGQRRRRAHRRCSRRGKMRVAEIVEVALSSAAYRAAASRQGGAIRART